jgi:hypothetical protein
LYTAGNSDYYCEKSDGGGLVITALSKTTREESGGSSGWGRFAVRVMEWLVSGRPPREARRLGVVELVELLRRVAPSRVREKEARSVVLPKSWMEVPGGKSKSKKALERKNRPCQLRVRDAPLREVMCWL